MKNLTTNVHPREKANVLSRLFFLWQMHVLFRGYRKRITETDLQCVLKEHESKYLGDKLEKAWLEEVLISGENASLWKVLAKKFVFEFGFWGVIFFLTNSIRVLESFFLWKILSCFTAIHGSVPSQAYAYIFLFIFSLFLRLICLHYCSFSMEHLGIKIRVACGTLIYRKCLKLSEEALSDVTYGQIINLVSTDIAKFNTGFLTYVHALWVFPMVLVMSLCVLNSICSFATTIGLIILLGYIFFQVFLSKVISSKRFKMAQKTDQRIRLLTEIIEGIKVVKMLAWEKPFKTLVETYRSLEMQDLVSSLTPHSINTASLLCLNKVAIFLCILTYVLTGNLLQSTYLFVLYMFYDNLRVVGVLFCSWATVFIGEIRTSVKRIERFLKNAEYQRSTETDCNGISLLGISVKKDILKDIYLTIKSPQKIAIIGSVGSGKSTILKVMLQEIPTSEGTVKVGGTVSYASQEPWIFDGTIKENILFGQKLDETKYMKVVEVCALERDFSILANGDLTWVGSKGAILSGGQKSRINLARAVYKEAELYLLDDPFSSVDVQVGEFIFKNCLKTYLKNKAVVLVTHQLEYLDEVDYIYIIESGTIANSGSYNDLKKSDYFEEIKIKRRENSKPTKTKLKDKDTFNSIKTVSKQKENVKLGKVSYEVYKNYFKAGGSISMTIFTFFLFALVQLLLCGSDYFLTFWVNLQQSQNVVPEYFLYIYVSLIVIAIPLSYMSTFILKKICATASKTLHTQMLHNIMNTPLSFFNINPSGRILNRFSSDVEQIDSNLPIIVSNLFVIATHSAGIVVIILTVNQWFLVPTIIIGAILIWYRKVYLSTSRFLKRVEAKSRSPVLSHLTSTLQGLSTIRVSGASQNQKAIFEDYQDLHTAAGYMFLACESAFGFWLDFGSFIYFVIVIINVIYLNPESRSGYIGLSVVSSLTLTGMMQFGMKQYAEWENKMVSVERVLEYTTLATEPEGKKMQKVWPTNGKIAFQNVSLQYSTDHHFSLKQVSFVINAKEKIGVVGRTGAGKSSLISVLFRLFDFEGDVFIDDTNTKTIPLPTLRSKIAIIPQDPVLFSCSIRTNLDPYEEYDDLTLWNVLAEVEMKSVVAALPSGLSDKVTEGGLNFSVGQRQLLCLARALLKMNKILILDEATANVDLKTDELIRETIRKKFKDCTVLTIAHRIDTIMDCHKLVVMDDGCVVEFGAPSKLLQDTKGMFYQLVHLKNNS